MKRLNDRSGLTLIEIVISLAILGIIVLAFSSMFSTGYVWVAQAGNISEALFDSQSKLENIISEKPSDLDYDSDLIFAFPTQTITVNGGIAIDESQSDDHRGQTVNLMAFIPNISSDPDDPDDPDEPDVEQILNGIALADYTTDPNSNPVIISNIADVDDVSFSYSNATSSPSGMITIGGTGITITRKNNSVVTGSVTLTATYGSEVVVRTINYSVPKKNGGPITYS